jgi:hypothetical protein
MKPALCILAAGIGSRYGGAKQIDPVGPSGERIIDYSIYDALRAGFGPVVFIINRRIEKDFRHALGDRVAERTEVRYAFQELDALPPGYAIPPGRKKPWGTAHAVLAAADVVREPFAALNADDFYGAGAYRAMADFLRGGETSPPAYSLVGFVLRQTLSDHGSVARAVCECDADGYLRGAVERTAIEREGDAAAYTDADGARHALTGDELVSMNFWGFTPRAFDHMHEGFVRFLDGMTNPVKDECYIPTIVDDLVARGKARCRVLRSDDAWFGVTYREDKPRVVRSIQALVDAGAYPANLWEAP